VSRIGAAVEPHDEVVLVGEDVYDFAFGFVAPLQPDDARATHIES
jgi:hypothetical protein